MARTARNDSILDCGQVSTRRIVIAFRPCLQQVKAVFEYSTFAVALVQPQCKALLAVLPRRHSTRPQAHKRVHMRHTMHAAGSSPCLLQAVRPRPTQLAAPVAAFRRPAARQRMAPAPAMAGYQQPLNNQQRKAKRAEAQRLGRSICTVRQWCGSLRRLSAAPLTGLTAAVSVLNQPLSCLLCCAGQPGAEGHDTSVS